MTLLKRYELILEQSMDELGPLEIPEERTAALELQSDLAPKMGDILYRLCIEHGVAYAPFRETVIAILADQKPAIVGHNEQPERVFAPRVEPVHPMILLALEMMPAEGADF